MLFITPSRVSPPSLMEAIFVPVRYLYQSGNLFNQRLGQGTSTCVKDKIIMAGNLS